MCHGEAFWKGQCASFPSSWGGHAGLGTVPGQTWHRDLAGGTHGAEGSLCPMPKPCLGTHKLKLVIIYRKAARALAL